MPETELTWRSVINPVAGSPALACNICCTISWAIHLVWSFDSQLYVSPTAIQYFDGGVIYN